MLAQGVVDIHGESWEELQEILSMVSCYLGDPERQQSPDGFVKLVQGVECPRYTASSLLETTTFQRPSENAGRFPRNP